jgi:thymidylate kinase
VSPSTPRKPGKLIVLEGPDGVGKSTLGREVVSRLQALSERSLLLAFPGNEAGTLGEFVYNVHHEATTGLRIPTPAALQALHIAAHLDAIERVILPALEDGSHVVLDRFWWSTWVYGVTAHVNRSVLRHLIEAERIVWKQIRPAGVILLQRNVAFFNVTATDRWRALTQEYQRLAAREAKHHPVLVIDNEGLVEPMATRVLGWVDQVHSGPKAQEASRRAGTLHASIPELSTGRALVQPMLFRVPTPQPTVVFDSYWHFAAERQNVFFRRAAGEPAPWTSDSIIAKFKFTNAYRASDRTTQYLVRRVIYRDDLSASANEVVFRILLFKLFNRIDTWEWLEAHIGPLTWADYDYDTYETTLSRALANGRPIYSAAYIMPPGGAFGEPRKHSNHLRLIEAMMCDRVPEKLADCSSMETAFSLLRSYPTLGDFLAYQFVTDINYSEVTSFSEMEFVVAGPGARDGIRKCFTDLDYLSEAGVIRWVSERQEEEFARRGLRFRSLWGRPLQLIDCQNLFCEVDKYARIAHPEVTGVSGRTRIKQRFLPTGEPFSLWYPPKWGINSAVATDPFLNSQKG